jgi:hypothetical protein
MLSGASAFEISDIAQRCTIVDVLVGASPAGGACSLATVVMLDNGKGDQPAESSGVKVTVGWVKARSDPPGSQANRQAVAKSEPGKPLEFRGVVFSISTASLRFSLES